MTAQNPLLCCELCPRRCRVDRAGGQKGFCGAGDAAEVYRWGPHQGEEPPLSGTQGSGTVFFSRCTLRCLYCQNHPWSQGGRGDPCSADALARVFRQLAERGCHNWNLVSPTPWLPMIRTAVRECRSHGVALPLVYNTSGFERVETLQSYEDLIDVYLADLRYSRPESAAEGSGESSYVEVARKALVEMWRRRGALALDPHGNARAGTLCRLLILPGRAHEVVENLEWLAGAVGTEIAVSVMAQYTPAYRAETRPGWDRPITREEYDYVCQVVHDLGFEHGWVQDFGGGTERELLGFEMTAGEAGPILR